MTSWLPLLLQAPPSRTAEWASCTQGSSSLFPDSTPRNICATNTENNIYLFVCRHNLNIFINGYYDLRKYFLLENKNKTLVAPSQRVDPRQTEIWLQPTEKVTTIICVHNWLIIIKIKFHIIIIR